MDEKKRKTRDTFASLTLHTIVAMSCKSVQTVRWRCVRAHRFPFF